MTDYYDTESRRFAQVVDTVSNEFGPDHPVTKYVRGEIRSGISTEVVVIPVDTSNQNQQ